jgi:choline-sulfatase
MGKQNMYDHSIRVPLILAGPGVPVGRRIDRLVYQSSLYPTLCDLASLSTPSTVEFPTLGPMLTDSSVIDPDEPLLFAYRDLQRLVRTRRWALSVYRPARRVQLHDVIADPWQIHDLAGEPEHATTVTRLLAELRRLQNMYDDDGDWTSNVDDGWLPRSGVTHRGESCTTTAH